MDVRQSHINFDTISRALSCSIEAVKERESNTLALEQLVDAQRVLQQAISFSCSRRIG